MKFTLIVISAATISFLLGYQPGAQNKELAEQTENQPHSAAAFTPSDESQPLGAEETLKPQFSASELAVRSWKDAEAIRERLLKWAETNPRSALAYTQNNVQPDFVRKEIMTAILHSWVTEAPNQAWDWAKENSPTDSARLITEIGKFKPQLAWEKAEEFSTKNPHFTSVSYGNAVLGTSFGGNYRAALELLESADIPVERERRLGKDAYIGLALGQWVRFAPEEALDWVSSLSEEEDPQRAIIAQDNLLMAWASTDPLAALEFTKTLPPSNSTKGSFSTALYRLMQLDMEGAKEWIESYGPSDEMNWSAADYATHPENLRNDVQSAIEFTENITDVGIRTDTLVEIAQEWYYQDPDAADEYFSEKQLLTPEQLQRYVFGHVADRIHRMDNPPPYDGMN